MQTSAEKGSDSDPGSSALGRGLAILRAINSTRTYISLLRIHEITGLPKSSIIRLLERLIAEGCVARATKRGCYRLSAGISSLVKGLDPIWEAIDVVERFPHLLSEYRWPVAIGTREGANLVVLFSTRRLDSPNSFIASTFGARAPLLSVAMGVAYASYCDDDERRRTARDLAGSAKGADEMLREIDKIAETTRARGYGLRLGGKGESTSVSVPLYGVDGELIGVIVESGFAVVMSPKDIKESANNLKRTADLITQHIREARSSGAGE